jgi:hypothetical protein
MMATPQEIDQWIAARAIDPRLWPLVVWFANQPASLQEALGALLKFLPHE